MKPIRFEGVYDPTIWKPVEGAEGYFVNMEGKIKGRSGKVLKGFPQGDYPSFSPDGGKSSLRIHRVVAQTFIGDIPEGLVVNHIDEDKTNANVMNLEICTQSHNTRHSVASRKPRAKRGKTIKDLSGWKPIPSIPTAMAHPSGRVASLDNCGRLRECLGSVNNEGYRRVVVARKSYRMHRLIAETFCPNPNNFPIVNHIDEDKLNNCASNLEWCTKRHNNLHGTARKRAAEKVSKPVIAKDSEGDIVHTFKSAAEASRNGFHSGHISSCCNGHLKTHKGLYWSFA